MSQIEPAFREAIQEYLDHLARTTQERLTGGMTSGPFASGELLVQKHTCPIEVPEELLMDLGVIPDTRPPRPPPSRRTRFRWWLAGQRERAARAAYRLIAGYDPPGGDE